MRCLVCLLIILFASTALGGSGMKWPTVKHELIGPTSGFSPGPVTYQLVIYPQIDSGCMGVSVVRKDSLIYGGPKRTYREFYDRAPLTFEFDLTVLPNDTSIFFIEMIEYVRPDRDGNSAIGYGEAGAIFAANESTVEILDDDPRPVRDYEMEEFKRQRDSARAVRDSIKAARKTAPPLPWDGWEGPLVMGSDSAGNVTWDSVASERLKQGIEPVRQVTPPPPPLPRDSVEKLLESRRQAWLEEARQVQEARQKERHPDRGGTPQEQMERFIRNHPIAEAVEFVADGPTLWVRREGDSVFTVSQPIKDRKAYREERANRNAEKRANQTYDIVLDLSKPEDRRFVEDLHLDLKATDRPEYFRTTVDRSVVKKLEAAKINWTAYPLLPDRTFAPEYIESEERRKKTE